MRICLLVLCLIAPIASAAHLSDLYVIPAAAHLTGANGTQWRSDVTIHNPGPSAITVDMLLIEMGKPAASSVAPVLTTTIAAGETRAFDDILRDLRTGGAILVTADAPFAISSRTYSLTDSGTVGQNVTAVDATDAADNAYLPGLTANARYRTNAGFFAASESERLVVEVMLVAKNGATLGTRQFTLEGSGFTHLQFSLAELAPFFEAATAAVRVVEGDGAVIPYASVVDNDSADATFLSGGMVATTIGVTSVARIAAAPR